MGASDTENMVVPKCDLVNTVSQFHESKFRQSSFLKCFLGCLTDQSC